MYNFERRRLAFQLVPYTAWYTNLRSLCLNWNEISGKIREPEICAICGKKTKELDAHEVWKYNDEKHLQLLDKIIPVCKKCHRAIHIGKANVDGKTEQALSQYMKVNHLSEPEAQKDMDEAFAVWQKRSMFPWTLDVEQIKETVFRQTGIVCRNDFCEKGRYYARVPFEKKDLAKRQGAKWDPEKKLWYFSDEKKRDAWNRLNT